MTASLASYCSVNARSSYLYLTRGSNNYRRGLQVIKVQSFEEEGRWTNIVDANLNVLKEKIELVKVKEKLERCCKCQHGWNYAAVYGNNQQLKRSKDLSNFVGLMSLICGTVSFTCFSGSLLLCLVSQVVHLLGNLKY